MCRRRGRAVRSKVVRMEGRKWRWRSGEMFNGAEGNSVCGGQEGTGGGPAMPEGGKERSGGSRTCGGLHTQAFIRLPAG